MEEALRPLADAALHPGCFLGALRLVGIDGTTWSVSSTPPAWSKPKPGVAAPPLPRSP